MTEQEDESELKDLRKLLQDLQEQNAYLRGQLRASEKIPNGAGVITNIPPESDQNEGHL